VDAVDGGHTCYGGAHCIFEVHALCERTHAFVCEPCWICTHVVNHVGYVRMCGLRTYGPSVCELLLHMYACVDFGLMVNL
jgi:hypothetical protein